MSSQFVEIYEIGTDAPTVSEIEENSDKTPPLNLTLKITKQSIVIFKGVNPIKVASIKKNAEGYAVECFFGG